MAFYSDTNGFPESGFPILSDIEDRIALNTLYYNPLKHLGYKIDVLGNNRLLGNLVLGGTLTGVSSLTMAGALSGVTTLAANNTVTLSHATAPLTITGVNATLLMTGWNASIGSLLQRIRRTFFVDLEVTNRPTVSGEPVALIGDLVLKQNMTVTKTTTGDGPGTEGMMQINTFDKTFKVYADGGWRQLATW